MNFSALVRSRLATLGCGQKDLARAAEVTDSYISQLLTRKKPPPARDRTDIYAKMEVFLRLEPGELGRLAEAERAAAALFGEERSNSRGINLADDRVIVDLLRAMQDASGRPLAAYPIVNGRAVSGEPVDSVNPADRSHTVGTCQVANAEHVDDAIAGARERLGPGGPAGPC